LSTALLLVRWLHSPTRLMKSRIRTRVLHALIPLIVAANAPAADEIILSNGDRLSGHIVGKSGDRVVIRTDYAGEVAVLWNQVASFTTEQAVQALLVGRIEPLRGRFNVQGEGRVEFVAEQGGEIATLDLHQIQYLNPKPYETPNGVDFKGRGLVSAAYARGNAESDRIYGEGEFNARARTWRYTLNGKIERREEPVVGVTASNWLLGARYDHFADSRHFRYVRSTLEGDRINNVDRRAAFGLGLGLQLVESERANISVRGGLDYISIDRITSLNERYPALGWGWDLKVKAGGGRAELFHNQEGSWNLKDTRAIIVRSKTGLRMPLVASLNGVAQLNVDWMRNPAPGRAPIDSTLLLGIDYTW